MTRSGAPLLLMALALAAAPEASGQTATPRPLDRGLAGLGRLASPGPLTRAHASLETLTGCVKCHEVEKKVVAARCLTCHTEIAKRIAARKGVHRKVSDTCVPCHVEHAGRDVELRPLDRKRFDHAGQAGFPLEGAHARIGADCVRCHKTRSFLTLSPACGSCHEDRHQGRLGPDCARCHSASVPFARTREVFDHGKARFALTGAHVRVPCEGCHRAKVFWGLPHDSCADCHEDPHSRPLGTCSTCHTPEGFRAGLRPGMIDHATTAFPLVGSHLRVPCASCHSRPGPRARPRQACSSCHADPHRGQFPEPCSSCHQESGFKGARFDHLARTGFALEGQHGEKPCAACHRSAAVPPGTALASRVVEFRRLPTSCASCHAEPHGGKLGSSCEKCHTPWSFRLSAFTHPRSPEFFTGRHATLACARCHRTDPAGGPRRFRGTSLACASCHVDPHLGQCGTSCKPCHSPEAIGFRVVGFEHAATRLPLTGAHARLACVTCHPCEERVYPAGRGLAVRLTGVSHECVDCHKDVHRGELGPRCEKCHTSSTFKRERRPHPDVRGGTGGDRCYDCHRPAYEKTRSPDHATTGLGTACATCHRSSDPVWSLGTYPHEAWPLLGAHASASCRECHASGVYVGLASQCVSCHLEEYQRAVAPDHAAQVPSSCEPCHRVSDLRWSQGAPWPLQRD